jgi:hypothetical protein
MPWQFEGEYKWTENNSHEIFLMTHDPLCTEHKLQMFNKMYIQKYVTQL